MALKEINNISDGNGIKKLETARHMKKTMKDYFARLKQAAESVDKRFAC